MRPIQSDEPDCVLMCIARLTGYSPEELKRAIIEPPVKRRGYMLEEFYPFLLEKGLIPIKVDLIVSDSFLRPHCFKLIQTSTAKNIVLCVNVQNDIGHAFVDEGDGYYNPAIGHTIPELPDYYVPVTRFYASTRIPCHLRGEWICK